MQIDREEYPMSSNLVSLITQFLTPDMIGRIATALGLDRNKVQTAIGALIPGLLAAFSNVATQPGGAEKLADAANQQAGTLANFANMIGGGGQAAFLEKGSQLLSSLIGSQDKNALLGAITKFAGINQGASGSLLGALAPIVIGSIAKHQGEGHAIDANGVANLLVSQKDNIAAALPPGFGNLLSGSGLMNSLGGAARTAAAVGNEAARAAGSTARVVGQSGQQAATAAASNWLYWLIPLAAVAALLVYFAVKPEEQIAQQGITATQNLMVSGVDLRKQVTDSIASLRTTLDGINDVSSAQTALPKLQEVTAQINKVEGLADQLSPEQRTLLTGLVGPLMPTLNRLFDKVLAIPGVAEVLNPSIVALKAKLTAIA
jgi:Bacterial protein of unknown function (DUF937)